MFKNFIFRQEDQSKLGEDYIMDYFQEYAFKLLKVTQIESKSDRVTNISVIGFSVFIIIDI